MENRLDGLPEYGVLLTGTPENPVIENRSGRAVIGYRLKKAEPTLGPAPDLLRTALQSYKAKSKRGTIQGFGQTRMMSSKEIIFAAGEGLEPGMTAEVALSWPFLLGGQVPLQLVLQVRIISSEDGMAEAQILAYDFRTAGPAGEPPKQIAPLI